MKQSERAEVKREIGWHGERSRKGGRRMVVGGHDVERVTVMQSDVVQDTMSTTVKPAKAASRLRNASW